MAELTVALMAGGKSRRMGQNKALIELDGQRIIERVLSRVRAGVQPTEILLITHEPELYTFLGLPGYPDVIPGLGALGGIYTALEHSQHTHALVLACDMPFVSPALLAHMADLRLSCDCDAIVPRVDGQAQGLCAIYSQACRDPIRTSIDAGTLKVISFYERVRVRYLDDAEIARYDPQGRTFFNVNTPEDLAAARAMLADEAS